MPVINLNVTDTETTGLHNSDQIVEIAVTKVRVHLNDDGVLEDVRVHNTITELAKPQKEINLEAMAVHHITPSMLANARPENEVLEDFSKLECDYWVAHNAAFDQRFCCGPGFDGKWICTMKVARVIYPEAPGYKNQVLRYWLGLDKYLDASRIEPVHRAGPDSYITAVLLGRMLATKKMLPEDMYLITSNAPDLIPFGKHKNKPWNAVPKDYLRWLIRTSTDQNVVDKARKYL